jgi:predicted TIM-barrel fold metal-dependent hydrolase
MKTVLDAVRRGEPLDFTPFIDVHGHFGPWLDTTVPYCLDYGRLIGEMDRYGCDMVWMTTSDPGYSAPMRLKNDLVFDLAEAHPDRVIPYCTLSANEPDRCLEELRRCLGRGRCIGVKMHRYEQPDYTVKSAFLQPVLELLAEQKLVYLNHGYVNQTDLQWALERYPDLVFMAGHFSSATNDLACRQANFKDCTCAAMPPDEVGNEVRRLGRSDTMLVGSDFGLFCLAFGIGMIAYAEMAEEHKRNILGLNAVKLLERTAWYSPALLRCTQGS